MRTHEQVQPVAWVAVACGAAAALVLAYQVMANIHVVEAWSSDKAQGLVLSCTFTRSLHFVAFSSH